MEFRQVLALRGPNYWSRHPVLEAVVDLGEYKDTPSNSMPGFNDRLKGWLPSMIEHRCSIGERGGFFIRLERGTYLAHILEHVSIELQTLAGSEVGFGKARETSTEGVYKVCVRYRDETVGRACLAEARELLLAAIHDRPYDIQAQIARLRELANRVCLGPSTSAIVDAAHARGIPARRLNAGSLVQLGFGARQRRIWTAETDQTGAIGEWVAQDKVLTKSLLRAAGVPVPEGRLVDSPDDAWQAAQEVGVPVVIKPRDANHARGVFTRLLTEEQVKHAFPHAAKEGSGVILERFAEGSEHRLLVVGDRVIAASRGEEAFIIGDGRRSVAQLIEDQLNADPRRGDSEDCPLNTIPTNPLDPITALELARQGHAADTVLPEGVRALVLRNGNHAEDVTDRVHPEVAARAVLAAQVVGLDVAGLDCVMQDVARPLEEQGGVIVEVNAGPGLLMHLRPTSGKPQPVGDAIVSTLFPAGNDGRIPIVAVTGTNGKSIVSRFVWHILRGAGRHVGLACSDGVFLGKRQIDLGDCSGPRSARSILLNPRVDAAVFEVGRGGILREGLGFDKCEVAVVTNIGEADHLGIHYIETPEAMAAVKQTTVEVVLPRGASVLNADDPLTANMAAASDGAVVFFSREAENPVVVEHRARGGKAVFVRDNGIIIATGDTELKLVSLERTPLTRFGTIGFQVENTLAAVGAAWSLGVEIEQIVNGLETFEADLDGLPGRFNIFEYRGLTVVLDDCHNVSAIRASTAALASFPANFRTIAFSAGGDRRDDDIRQQGELIGRAFDRIILYERDLRSGRPPGAVIALLKEGLASSQQTPEILEAEGSLGAMELGLQRGCPGELLVLQPDEVSDAVAFLKRRLAPHRDRESVGS